MRNALQEQVYLTVQLVTACFSEEEMQLLIEEIPADRLGRPEEVAALALQLTQSPTYLTGQIITIDGGFL